MLLRGEHGNAVFKMPVWVVTEADVDAAQAGVQHIAYEIGLVAEHDVEARDARRNRGAQRADDQRLTENTMEELRLAGAVHESIAVSRREHESPPDGHFRR